MFEKKEKFSSEYSYESPGKSTILLLPQKRNENAVSRKNHQGRSIHSRGGPISLYVHLVAIGSWGEHKYSGSVRKFIHELHGRNLKRNY